MTSQNQTTRILGAVRDSLGAIRVHLELRAERLCLDCGCVDEDKAIKAATETDQGAALVEIGLVSLVEDVAHSWAEDDRFERRSEFGRCRSCGVDPDEGRNDFDGFRMEA